MRPSPSSFFLLAALPDHPLLAPIRFDPEPGERRMLALIGNLDPRRAWRDNESVAQSVRRRDSPIKAPIEASAHEFEKECASTAPA